MEHLLDVCLTCVSQPGNKRPSEDIPLKEIPGVKQSDHVIGLCPPSTLHSLTKPHLRKKYILKFVRNIKGKSTKTIIIS